MQTVVTLFQLGILTSTISASSSSLSSAIVALGSNTTAMSNG